MVSIGAPRESRWAAIVVAVALAGAVTALAGTNRSIWAAFSAPSGVHGNEVRAAADWVAPAVEQSVIQKTQGGVPGYVRQGGAYRLYASVSDDGRPASGVASLSGDLSELTAGTTARPLGSGSFTVGGRSYNFATASTTARTPLAERTYTYSLTSVDAAGNSRLQGGFPVVVDNTAPGAADVQTQNQAATVGRPELGDTVSYTFSEPVDPQSIVSGWDGAATDVVVRLSPGVFPFSTDLLVVYNATNSSQLPLGELRLGRVGYVSTSRTFGVAGTKSRMVLSGNTITVTLGTPSGSTSTVSSNSTLRLTPASAAYDRAGNPMSTTAANESGAADREF